MILDFRSFFFYTNKIKEINKIWWQRIINSLIKWNINFQRHLKLLKGNMYKRNQMCEVLESFFISYCLEEDCRSMQIIARNYFLKWRVLKKLFFFQKILIKSLNNLKSFWIRCSQSIKKTELVGKRCYTTQFLTKICNNSNKL